MAAKVAGVWRVLATTLGSVIGIEDLTTHGTTKLHPLGTRVNAKDMGSTDYGFGEFVYLSGLDATVRGTPVLIATDYTTTLVAERDAGGIALALSACVTGEYGWYQVRGTGVAAMTTCSKNLPLYIDQAGALLSTTATIGDCVIGARSVTDVDTGTAVVTLGVEAATADFDNATH